MHTAETDRTANAHIPATEMRLCARIVLEYRRAVLAGDAAEIRYLIGDFEFIARHTGSERLRARCARRVAVAREALRTARRAN